MQVGKLLLQHHVIMVGTGDIAGAAGAGAATVERLMHSRQHRRILSHAEIIVRAPHRHLILAGRVVMGRAREGAGAAFQIGKDTVATFTMQAIELAAEKAFVIHLRPPVDRGDRFGLA